MNTPKIRHQDSATDPILNPSHLEPYQHWALDGNIQAQNIAILSRRSSEQIPIIPGSGVKRQLDPQARENDPGRHWPEIPRVNELRREVKDWQTAGYPDITETTRQLLSHWSNLHVKSESDRKLYFAQMEAVLTHIYLKESQSAKAEEHRAALRGINASANRNLNRLCHKMATGTGKTLAMAMLILWQSGNHRHNPEDYSNYILIFTPGLIVRERLMESLQPNPPNGQDSDYRKFNLVPNDDFWEKALNDTHLRIHNFHRFQPRPADDPLSRHAAQLIAANRKGEVIRERLETRQETASRLTGLPIKDRRPIFVINDEGHHCHSGSKQVKPNTWLQGLLTLDRQHPILTAVDMSATPVYFTEKAANPPLFEWIVSDYPLIEAMEAGLVKIPQAPFNFKDAERYLNIYQNCQQEERTSHSKSGNKALTFRWKDADNPNCAALTDGLNLLYADYEKEFRQWSDRYPEAERPATVPGNPVMAIIMNSIANANAMYEYLTDPGKGKPLFQNDNGRQPPRTIVLHSRIDQDKDDAGAVDKEIRANAAILAAAYRRRHPKRWNEDTTDDEVLREVLTTVGKPGQPGEQVRCVISVNMLTEGWDARNVTHILGFRAFQSSLLCEQAAGRALRRVSYDYEENDPDNEQRLKPEYATIMGIPFPGIAEANGKRSNHTDSRAAIQVSPCRDDLDIELPNIIRLQRNAAAPTAGLRLRDNPTRLIKPIAPAKTSDVRVEPIVGEADTITVHRATTRGNFLFKVAAAIHGKMTQEQQADTGLTGEIPDIPLNQLFAQLQRITDQCLDQGLITGPADRLAWSQDSNETQRAAEWLHKQLEVYSLAPAASQPVSMRAIPHHSSPVIHTRKFEGRSVKARHAYPESAATMTLKSPISHAVCDSGWEVAVARLLDELPPVNRWLRNYGLNWSLPYIADGEYHQYRPDFVAVCPLANGQELHLVIEVKGQELFNDRIKRDWAEHWCAAVNAHPDYGQNKVWQYLYLDEIPRREYVERQIAAAIAKARQNGE